jgi:hypothetical protein
MKTLLWQGWAKVLNGQVQHHPGGGLMTYTGDPLPDNFITGWERAVLLSETALARVFVGRTSPKKKKKRRKRRAR